MTTSNSLQQTKARKQRILYTCAPLAALLAGFAYWLFSDSAGRIASIVAAAALLFLFAVCVIRLVPQWQRAWSGEPLSAPSHETGRRSGRRARMHPFFRIVCLAALSRLILFVAAYLVLYRKSGYQGGVFDLLTIWNPVGADSRHYLYLAEHWYPVGGDAQSLLAFFPFYPAAVRALNYIFQNHLVTGLFVSNIAFVFAAYLLYELTLFDADRGTGLRAVKYLCILPGSLLLCAPMPDSLFLLLSVGCLYLARKKQYLFASLMGMFAAFCGLPGVLLAVPLAMELFADYLADRRLAESGRALRRAYAKRFLGLLLVPLGLLLYLWINFSVSGEWFRFLGYRQEVWGRGLSFFFNTAAYQTAALMSAVASRSLPDIVGLWGPNLLYLFGSLAILVPAIPKLRSAYTVYFLLYFALTMGATRLLSAPRCLMAAFPLVLALAAVTKKRWADIAATGLCLAGLAVYLYAFVMQWHVY